MDLKQLEEHISRAHSHAQLGTLIYATFQQATHAFRGGEGDECERLMQVAQELRRELREALEPPVFDPEERQTHQTPATPEAIEQFREQLAARPLPDLEELEPYAAKLPELEPLVEIGKIDTAGDGKSGTEHIEGATLKPELATEPQQESEPVTKKEPAESASGEPQENA